VNLAEFEAGFRVVRDSLNACVPLGRQAGVSALFGNFTRRAIAAGMDRTRFVDWFGPAHLLSAPAGRIRGRVLYYDKAKGRGKVLGSDRVVYFVHFSMIQGDGFRSLDDGQLVEFTARPGTFNGVPGVAAYDVARLTEGEPMR
jgi:CspA family cold shock protein